jgi:acyl dehydratase
VSVAIPYFEDLSVGQEFVAPGVTLTSAHAAWYQAVTGDRLQLPLDHALSAQVTGAARPLVHPMLAVHVAIGQSTWASQRVKGNLYYRDLVLRRPVFVGDTLRTRTRVVGLRRNRLQPGREPTGLVALEIRTCDSDGHELLRFGRCPMIACRDAVADHGPRDELAAGADRVTVDAVRAAAPPGWRLAPLHGVAGGIELRPGVPVDLAPRDTVTAAPELVRLTLNLALAHTDPGQSHLGARLVYGGHTISIAFAQVTRALPALATLLAWEHCDHTGPVLEGDCLRSTLTLLGAWPATNGRLVRLRVLTQADRADGAAPRPVLDWTFWALDAS